jgi:hypothetical protein
MPCKKCGPKKCCCSKQKVITRLGLPGRNAPTPKRGKQGVPGAPGTSELPIKNVVFVSKNGNDSTGLVERLDKPFLTITAATNAIIAAYPVRTNNERVMVWVFDGYYEEHIVLKKFVDFELTNIVLNGTITDNNVDMGSSDPEHWTNVVTGRASIRNTRSAPNTGAIVIFKPNTKLLVYCNEATTERLDSIVVIDGRLRVYCNLIHTYELTGNSSPAIELAQGFLEGDITNDSLVEIIGADISNSEGSKGAVIQFNLGGTDKRQTLVLIDCRVKCLSDAESDIDKSAIAAGAVNDSDGKVVLYNTVLYTENGSTSIDANSGNTLDVSYYHSNMANVAVGGSGTINNVLSTTLTVNAAVKAEF